VTADHTIDAIVDIEGLRTRVRVCGEGPAVLLLGGVWSQVDLWEGVSLHLAGFRTISFDPPGIGATELPRRPYSIRRLAAFAAHVLDAVGVERAHVLGVSLGGAVAQQLAHDFPARVAGLVLVSTAYGLPPLPGRPGAVLRFMHPRLYRDRDQLERNAGTIFGGRLRREPELVRGWHLRPPRSLRAYLWRLLGTAGWSSLPWLHRLSSPTLVVHGDDDPIVPLLNARALAWAIQPSTLHVVSGGGHLLLLDSAPEVFPVITEFLSCSVTISSTSDPQGNAS
jgi:poly(3-hydroxyalkanoate) depolymerase